MSTRSTPEPSSSAGAPAGQSPLVPRLLLALKITIPVLVVGWLLWRIPADQWEALRNRPKQWGFGALAFVLLLCTVLLSFLRWRLLVRALDLPFRVRDALRLGFLGYFCNFIGTGGFGGDLFKAVFIARGQPGRQPEAVATVLADRVVGLYGLLVVGAAAALYQSRIAGRAMMQLLGVSLEIWLMGAVGVGGIFLMLMLTPGFSRIQLSRQITQAPWIGPVAHRLLTAIRMFRERRGVIVAVMGMSIAIHIMAATSFYLLARCLYPKPPGVIEHMVAVPLATIVNAISVFTPGGFGAMEFALDELYRATASDGEAAGVLVALAYRICTIGIALIGGLFYALDRDVLSGPQATGSAAADEEFSDPLGDQEADTVLSQALPERDAL